MNNQLHTYIPSSSAVPPVHMEGTREAVGLFQDEHNLQQAIRELEATAFPRDAISVLGTRRMIEEKFGQATVNPELAEDDPHVPKMSPIRPEEQTIGAGVLVGCSAYVGITSALLLLGPASIPATLMAVALGGTGGAALAGLLVNRLNHKLGHDVEEQIARGGLILWVRTPDLEREQLACDILTRHGAQHVKVHDLA